MQSINYKYFNFDPLIELLASMAWLDMSGLGNECSKSVKSCSTTGRGGLCEMLILRWFNKLTRCAWALLIVLSCLMRRQIKVFMGKFHFLLNLIVACITVIIVIWLISGPTLQMSFCQVPSTSWLTCPSNCTDTVIRACINLFTWCSRWFHDSCWIIQLDISGLVVIAMNYSRFSMLSGENWFVASCGLRTAKRQENRRSRGVIQVSQVLVNFD